MLFTACVFRHGLGRDLHRDVLEVRTLSADHLRMLRYCGKPPSSNKMRTKIKGNTNELYAADLPPRNNRHRLGDAQYIHCIGPVFM
jgi:hypothetical protein